MSFFTSLDDLIREAGCIETKPPTLEVVEKRKKRFMLVGTHAHQTTGYSKVTYNIIQELSKLDEFELFHFGFQKFMNGPPEYRPYPAGVDVYDTTALERSGAAPQEQGFGFSQLGAYIQKVKPDIVLIYNDAGVICQFLEKVNSSLSEAERKSYKLIIYLDQVYLTQRPEFLARINQDADAYITFTEYWKTILQKQGINKRIGVLRHGFDSNVFKPLDRNTLRKKHNIPENVIIFLNLNRNTPRKRYDIVVQAFAQLVARHPTKPLGLLCVCDNGTHGGFPIQEIFLRELQNLNVNPQFHSHKLMISQNPLTYTDELINELYNLSDVGITAAEGEGFGLCQFEAMGVGIPQVVPNIGGFRDYCNKNNSMLVEPKMRLYIANAHSSVGGMAEYVDYKELAKAAEEYIFDSELRKKHGKAAMETVLKYTWKTEVANLAQLLREI
jgi:glycosyltransferase involved in cell wall biosynthesis